MIIEVKNNALAINSDTVTAEFRFSPRSERDLAKELVGAARELLGRDESLFQALVNETNDN
ncbi:hypothetical protein [Desulfovibrio gilichinskyi]|uniref:Uncharacterized protein n=1 Tax=Desulfovibrio gilichinskyi TaxID=1519643 RepID=A0A1X7C3H5_9BACT|nr:hypothetical protein [Desulfovibrio gilichinskyi]SME89297.1 hypothetical protein SAMN06295933_0267 [Desulfovibrio gilichinskyi]